MPKSSKTKQQRRARAKRAVAAAKKAVRQAHTGHKKLVVHLENISAALKGVTDDPFAPNK